MAIAPDGTVYVAWSARVGEKSHATTLYLSASRDGGKSFEVLSDGLPQSDCFDLVYRHGLSVGSDGRQLLMGSTTGQLWASGDGGDRWQHAFAHLPPI